MKQPSEITGFFMKNHVIVRIHTVYNVFTLIGHLTLRLFHNMMH